MSWTRNTSKKHKKTRNKSIDPNQFIDFSFDRYKSAMMYDRMFRDLSSRSAEVGRCNINLSSRQEIQGPQSCFR